MKTLLIKHMAALLFALLFTVGVSNIAFADTGQIIVEATGFNSNEGQALFAVVASPEAYEDIGKNAIAKSMLKIKSGKSQGCFHLPYGWYAVSVVHDHNNNGKLDKNFLGLPKEPYGFSNNPSALGKPSFQAVKFKMDSSQKVIEVNVQ